MARPGVGPRRGARLFFCGSALAGALSCGKRLDSAECAALLDRYTERLVREESPGASPERVAEATRAARDLARRSPVFEFDRCAARISRREFECAMQAPTVDEIERCLVF